MSVENNAPNGAEPTANAEGVEGTESQGSASEVNARLLEESKKNKKLAQEWKAKAETFEKERLAAQGKEKERADYFEKKYTELKHLTVKSSVKNALTLAAQKAGARDLDAVFALANKELIQYDETSNEVLGADQAVEELKKTKDYLFVPQKAPTINGASPGGVVKGVSKKYNEMTKDEIMSQLRALGK